MSQAKVDRYKEQKLNRKEIMQKEKRKKMIRRITGTVIGLCLVGWLGLSAYNFIDDLTPRESVVVDYTAVDTYLSTIS